MMRFSRLDCPHDLEVPGDAHPQAGVDVADLQRRGQTMAGRVGDRDALDLLGDLDEVEEVAADDLRRHREPADVEDSGARRALRQDRHLDLTRLVHDRDEAFLPELLIHGVAEDPERGDQVVVGRVRVDREREDVLVVPHRDRGEALHAEPTLELRVHAGRRQVEKDDTLRR